MSLSGNPERWSELPVVRPCACADCRHPLPCPKPAVRVEGVYKSPALCLGCTYGCENDRED